MKPDKSIYITAFLRLLLSLFAAAYFLPLQDAALHVDGVVAPRVEPVGGSHASHPAAAVDQASVLLAEQRGRLL